MFKEERRKMLKSKRIDESIKTNINLQQPPTTTSESSISLFTKDIKKLRKIVENQNLQIQLLQEKTDLLKTKDSEKEVQIQSKNDEIILLKQTIQSQQENHAFLFNSNAKIWSTLNNLEKQISSNSKYSESNESKILKEITFLDIKKYLQKNPKEAADVERIAKDVKSSLEKKLSDFNESNSESEKDKNLLRKRNHKRQRRMGEKSDKQKNVDNYFKSTTIDEKLEKLGISNTKNIFRGRRSLSPKNSLSNIRNSFIEATAMPDQFDDDWSSCEKNVSEEEKNVYPRRFLSPKMQYCKADLYSFSTVPVDQFDDNADWSSLEKNESEEEKQKHVSHHHCRSSPTNSIINGLTTSPFADNGDDADSIISSIVSKAPTIDYRRSFTDVTQQLDQFNDNSDSDDENVILERRRKNRLSAVLENPNITSSCSKQYREKIQNSFSDATVMPDQFDDEWSSSEKNETKNLRDQSVNEKQNLFSEVTVMPDQFDDDWSSSEKNDSKNLDQSLNENDFYMEIPNNFHLWSKNQNKSKIKNF